MWLGKNTYWGTEALVKHIQIDISRCRFCYILPLKIGHPGDPIDKVN